MRQGHLRRDKPPGGAARASLPVGRPLTSSCRLSPLSSFRTALARSMAPRRVTVMLTPPWVVAL